MKMVKLPRAELLELFLQEVDSYLPEIRQGLASLEVNKPAMDTLDELHRYFHNIKGAAAQVRLTGLSKGARVVEVLLADLVEGGRPATAEILAALNQTVDLLDEFIHLEDLEPEEEILHQRIADLFSKLTEDDGEALLIDMSADKQSGVEEGQDCNLAIRSVLPLLQELAGYLSQDGSDGGEHDAKVYEKLAQAALTLAAASRSAGLEQQYQLMYDFHLLLEKLQAGALRQQPEVPGLIVDFLQFLEVVFTSTESENSTILSRVKDQLHRLHTLLAMAEKAERTVPDAMPVAVSDEDIFAVEEPGDESVMLLEELADSLLSEDQGDLADVSILDSEESERYEEEPEPENALLTEIQDAPEEPLSEEQLLLLDIFRSECEEHLIVINHSLNILENEVKDTSSLTPGLLETISVMRRAVHTLKGAAAMTGMNLTAQSAHVLEDMLDWLHDDAKEISPEEIQIIANGIDTIELLAQSAQTGESTHLQRIVKTINDYLAIRKEAVPIEAAVLAEQVESVGDSVSSEDIVPPAPAAVIPEPEITVDLPGESGILRVKLDDLDELVGIEGELVVARGAIEKMMDEFHDTLYELETVKENLRRKSQELESGFEGQALYGFSPQAGEETSGSDFSEFDPIELDRYSQLNLIIRSLNEISVDVNSIHASLLAIAGDIGGQISKQQLTMRLMQEKLMRIRMTPMSSLSRMLFRTVRETVKKLNKKANLVITGEDVYMDRFVWAKITDPLMHILRNALDHGIETPAKRVATGKPESGTIHLEADQRSRFVLLKISDDGGGINLEEVREKVRRSRLAHNPDTLSEKELLEFLFHPSFTTRQDISTISGRGIGLDVVRKNIQDLRGSVQIFNNPGLGVTFEIRIPFSLSVNRAVMVSVGGRMFAVPLQDIQQIKRFSPEQLEEDGGLHLHLGDDSVPVVNLGFYLNLEKLRTTIPSGREGILAILFAKGDKQFAISVEEIVEQREIIVKNLGSHLTNVLGISGVTLTGSGDLIPIINLREIVEKRVTAGKAVGEAVAPTGLQAPLKVLIVDDSISVRHSVARLVEGQGWKQQQAVDGIDALAKLETYTPDVIVLDIEMPRMNGYELKSNLNNKEWCKDIPVIMLTSRASEKHQQKARELGIQHYMTKPYQEDVFVRLLASIHSGYVN
ncbi:MAG: Hpt domain-containing protein [Desulforhopalus sp.]|nr:Hpt domain-containing protein [Desulforhopalus sp.]